MNFPLEIDFDDIPFDTLPPHVGAATSLAAAIAIEPSADTLRGEVLAELRKRDATDEQLQMRLHMNPSTQRPRRVELVKMGLVRDSGMRRNTSSGRKAIVWECAR